MANRPSRRTKNSRMVVRLPERSLSRSVLHVAAPLLEQLGSEPPADEVRRAVALSIDVWNAHVSASRLWGRPKTKPLAELRRAMRRETTVSGRRGIFELLSARWREEFDLDPRLVGEWTLTMQQGANGYDLVCETRLPDGIEAEVPPPADKRVSIGGKFLDEVRIREGETTYVAYPIEHHRGVSAPDGMTTIYTRAATVLELFAQDVLKPVGKGAVSLVLSGKMLGLMVLSEVRIGGDRSGAVLVFRPTDSSNSG